MKRRIAILLIMVWMLIGAGIVEADAKLNKWEGFRGLKWAANIKDVNDMVLCEATEDKLTKLYIKTTDKLFIGKAKLEDISYGTYKDKFYFISINLKGYSNFRYLRDAVTAHYGKGYKDGRFNEKWIWPYGRTNGKIYMVLKHNEFSEKTHWHIWYRPICVEKVQDDKDAAKNAKDDF